MKKIATLALAFCIMLTAVGCNNSSEADNESTKVATEATTASKTEEASTTEAKPQTEQTTEETKAEIVTPQIELLKLDKKTIYEAEWSDEYGILLAETRCSSILLHKDMVKQYPELAKALSENSEYYETVALDYHSILKEDANESISNGIEGFDTLVSTSDVYVRRADEVVLSILNDCYDYNGMNDGVRGFSGDNYDVATGKMIFLPDVVTDMDELAKTVEAELFSAYGKASFDNENSIREYFEMYGSDGTHWTLEYNGVTMYFGEGEIANRGIGNISVTIEFAEYPELFKEKYTKAPESYIVGLPMKSSFIVDLDNDGKCDELTLVDSKETEPAQKITLDISTSDVSYVETFWAYDCDPYFIKTADGRNYIYAFFEMYDSPELFVFEIIDKTRITNVGRDTILLSENDGVSSLITDPENMYLRIFTLDADYESPEYNTYFKVGSDGMPVQG